MSGGTVGLHAAILLSVVAHAIRAAERYQDAGAAGKITKYSRQLYAECYHRKDNLADRLVDRMAYNSIAFASSGQWSGEDRRTNNVLCWHQMRQSESGCSVRSVALYVYLPTVHGSCHQVFDLGSCLSRV